MSAARAPSPCAAPSLSRCARRGWVGRSSIAAPRAVRRPPASSASSRVSRSRASPSARAGGGSSHGRASGSAPHCATSSSVGARSASRISGGRRSRRAAWVRSLHRRYAVPGATRPARPARWVAASRVTRSVTRRLRPVAGSVRATRASPPSTTTRTPSMVRLVSAMFVASTTFRRPSGSGRRARRCSCGERSPYSGSTRASGCRAASASCARLISPLPGRKASTSPACAASASETFAATACATSPLGSVGRWRSSTG